MLSVEASELLEPFQWLTDAQSASLPAGTLRPVRLERADVLLYLARLADRLDAGLMQAAREKMALNALRYPVETVRGRIGFPTASPWPGASGTPDVRRPHDANRLSRRIGQCPRSGCERSRLAILDSLSDGSSGTLRAHRAQRHPGCAPAAAAAPLPPAAARTPVDSAPGVSVHLATVSRA